MVKLLSLQARNFKKLRLDSPVQFSDGITVITGLNESGKSSILDAILYALFGRAIRPPRAKNEDLVAYGANEATVRVDFEIGERTFRVSRTLSRTKPTRANLEELRANKTAQSIASGHEKVNEEIERLLGGITYHEIVSSTVVAQKELNKLVELNKDDRRKVINAFLNLDSFNVVGSEFAAERRDLEGSSGRMGRLQIEQDKLAELKREFDEFQRCTSEKEALADDSSRLNTSVEELQVRFKEKDALYSDMQKFNAATRAREAWTVEIAGKQRLLDDQRSRKERLSREIDATQTQLVGLKAHDQARPVFREIEGQIELTKSLALELSVAERNWKQLELEVQELDRRLTPAKRLELERSVVQVNKPVFPYAIMVTVLLAASFVAFALGYMLVGILIALISSIPASVAGTRLVAARSIARHQLTLGDLRYWKGKTDELATSTRRASQLREQLDYTQEGLAKLCASVHTEVESNPTTLQVANLETAEAILESARKQDRIRDAAEVKLQTLKVELSSLPEDSKLGELATQINALQQRSDSLEFPTLPDGIRLTPTSLSETLTARDGVARKLASVQSRIQQNAKRLRILDKYLSDHVTIPSRVQSQKQIVDQFEHRLEVVKRAIDGVNATSESLRNRIRPNVQGHMSAVLPALTSSKYKSAILDDDYNLRVWDPEAGEYKPKDVYSGGTEDQFLLAMRISFALALLPEVKGQKPEFVFLDEPLGSSDEVRRAGIIEYLADDLSRKFKQIFVISHVGGLEEHAQNVIALEDGVVV